METEGFVLCPYIISWKCKFTSTFTVSELAEHTDSVSIFGVISVLMGLHLTEEIAIGLNSETDFSVVVSAKADKGTVSMDS